MATDCTDTGDDVSDYNDFSWLSSPGDFTTSEKRGSFEVQTTLLVIVFDNIQEQDKPVLGKQDLIYLSVNEISGPGNEIEDKLRQALESKYSSKCGHLHLKVGQFVAVHGFPSVTLRSPLLRNCNWYAILDDDEGDNVRAIMPKCILGSSFSDELSKLKSADELQYVQFARSVQVLDIMNRIDKESKFKFHLFHNSKKLFPESNFEPISKDAHEIFILPLKECKKHLKILYSVGYDKDIIHHVRCFTTDAIKEVKAKFLLTLKDQSMDQLQVCFSRPLSNFQLADDDAVNKSLYVKSSKVSKEAFNALSGSESEDEDLFKIVDLVAHVGKRGCIGVTVKYSKPIRKATFTLVDCNSSTEYLREQIGKTLHKNPMSLKLSVGGKDVPELTTLSSFKELKAGCVILVKVKPQISLTIEGEGGPYNIEEHIMQSVANIKENISSICKKPTKMFELYLAGELLNENCTLNDYGIDTGTVFQMKSHDKRIIVNIKNMASQATLIRAVNAKFNSISIDDPSSTTVKTLKSTLGKMLDVATSEMELELQGLKLVDSNTVSESKLKDGDTVVVSTAKPKNAYSTNIAENFDIDVLKGLHSASEYDSKLSAASSDVPTESEYEDFVTDGFNNVIQSLQHKTGNLRQSKSDPDGCFDSGEEYAFGGSHSSTPLAVKSEILKRMVHSVSFPNELQGLARSNSEEAFPTAGNDIVEANLSCKYTTCTGKQFYREVYVKNSNISDYSGTVISATGQHAFHRGAFDKILRDISGDIPPTSWKFLGRSLNVDESDLTDIDTKGNGIKEKIYQMLNHWRTQKRINASLQDLKCALKENSLQAVAQKINDLEQKMQVQKETYV